MGGLCIRERFEAIDEWVRGWPGHVGHVGRMGSCLSVIAVEDRIASHRPGVDQ